MIQPCDPTSPLATPTAHAAELARLLQTRHVPLHPPRATGVVGLVLPASLDQADNNNHPNLFETILGVAGGLKSHGLAAAMLDHDDLFDGSAHALPQVDAVIALSHVPADVIEAVRRLYHSTVWVDTSLWLPHACIRRDELAAGRLAAQAAVDAGYRRFVVVSLPLHRYGHYSHGDRREGIAQVAEATGVEVDLFECGGLADEDPSVVDALLDRLTPDAAVIAVDYYRLEWLLGQLLLTDRRPGRDFGVVCCDNASRVARSYHYIVRTRFDRFALGCIAANMATHLLRHPDDPPLSFVTSPELIPGLTLPGPRGG